MFKKFIINRLSEASTMRGIVMFVTGALGFHLAPEVMGAVVSVGVSLAGLIGVLMPDSIKRDKNL
jgi:hypothetical protein